MWREAPQDVREKFQEQARLEKEEHQRKYPEYRYQPIFRRTDIIRRRVRKDPVEDEKVEVMAEALIKGKKGDELENEVKDVLGDKVEASSESGASTRSRRYVDSFLVSPSNAGLLVLLWVWCSASRMAL